MMARLNVQIEKCTGCRLCEMACSLKHEGVFFSRLSRIRHVWTSRGKAMVSVCRACDPAPCQIACPAGAISLDPGAGVLAVNEAKCIGCLACVETCPYHALIPHQATGRPMYCDLCGGEAACAEICPTKALSVV